MEGHEQGQSIIFMPYFYREKCLQIGPRIHDALFLLSVSSIHRTFLFCATEDTSVCVERRLIKMCPWVRMSLWDNYAFFFALPFDLFTYCNFMVSCKRKLKS